MEGVFKSLKLEPLFVANGLKSLFGSQTVCFMSFPFSSHSPAPLLLCNTGVTCTKSNVVLVLVVGFDWAVATHRFCVVDLQLCRAHCPVA